METSLEKILVYLGPSLPLAEAREILADAIFRPPCKQGDIITDLVRYNPTRLLLIDGQFRDNLSPWAKELVYALQYPCLKGVYGASSMGAIRGSELDFLGMIGVGQVYEWYRDGVTEDESEVAVSYASRQGVDGPLYYLNSVPLIDIRAGVEQLIAEFSPDVHKAKDFLYAMSKVYYADRTEELCAKAWGNSEFPLFPQKRADAIELLSNYKEYSYEPEIEPHPDHLNMFFAALFERDRRIEIGDVEVPQQHVDAHLLLHSPDYERICWDSANQELALMLCNCLGVMVSVDEIDRESCRFQIRADIETQEQFERFLHANGWSQAEYDRLMIQNCRIRKLQHALTVTKLYRRNTQAILDYLRTHQDFAYWATEASRAEKKIADKGVDDWLPINLTTPVFTTLMEHFEKEGLELNSSAEEYLLETGFCNLNELGVALARTIAGKEEK